jgi:serine/threonine protein kinase
VLKCFLVDQYLPGTLLAQITMSKLGYCLGVLEENDMKRAVRACLAACAHLHEAANPICHCDIRIDNVLWGPDPFLSDLELAHADPWAVGDVRLVGWEDGTLDGGRYA